MPALTPAHAAILRRHHEAGRARYGDLGLLETAFADAVLERVLDRLAVLDLEPTAERVEDALQRLCGDDLWLAQACEARLPDAWDVLAHEYTPRLIGLAVKQGANRSAAEDLATTLVGDLALPPGPSSRKGTLLGTYRGTGSLFGWLAMILVRRMAGDARRKKPLSLEVTGAPSGADVVRSKPSADPGAALTDAESRRALKAALRHAWSRCTPRERFVLALKFRDERSHKWIASCLQVGVPRVSQLLAAGLQRLGAAARARFPEGLDEAIAPGAAETARVLLASLEVGEPPTVGPSREGGVR